LPTPRRYASRGLNCCSTASQHKYIQISNVLTHTDYYENYLITVTTLKDYLQVSKDRAVAGERITFGEMARAVAATRVTNARQRG